MTNNMVRLAKPQNEWGFSGTPDFIKDSMRKIINQDNQVVSPSMNSNYDMILATKCQGKNGRTSIHHDDVYYYFHIYYWHKMKGGKFYSSAVAMEEHLTGKNLHTEYGVSLNKKPRVLRMQRLVDYGWIHIKRRTHDSIFTVLKTPDQIVPKSKGNFTINGEVYRKYGSDMAHILSYIGYRATNKGAEYVNNELYPYMKTTMHMFEETYIFSRKKIVSLLNEGVREGLIKWFKHKDKYYIQPDYYSEAYQRFFNLFDAAELKHVMKTNNCHITTQVDNKIIPGVTSKTTLLDKSFSVGQNDTSHGQNDTSHGQNDTSHGQNDTSVRAKRHQDKHLSTHSKYNTCSRTPEIQHTSELRSGRTQSIKKDSKVNKKIATTVESNKNLTGASNVTNPNLSNGEPQKLYDKEIRCLTPNEELDKLVEDELYGRNDRTEEILEFDDFCIEDKQRVLVEIGNFIFRHVSRYSWLRDANQSILLLCIQNVHTQQCVTNKRVKKPLGLTVTFLRDFAGVILNKLREGGLNG